MEKENSTNGESGMGDPTYKRVKVEDLESITKYADNSRYVIMDWLDANPTVMLPAGLMAAMTRSLTSSIHVSHSPLLRQYHDAQWVERFGDTRNYPVQVQAESTQVQSED